MEKLLKRKPSNNLAVELGFELLQASTKIHLNHLLVNGSGAYSAHKAMNDFYDSIKDFGDSFIEQWQGVTETLMVFPTAYSFPMMKTSVDCINYLKELYNKLNNFQKECPYSEICNLIDEVKSLINSTKYKLLFLK